MRVIINLRENPSTISSLVLLLDLISQFPTNELRVAMNAPKLLQINYESVMMSRNALGILYESSTILRIGEFMANVLNSSKLLSQFLIDLQVAITHYGLCDSVKILELSTIQPRIQIFVNSCQFVGFGACVE